MTGMNISYQKRCMLSCVLQPVRARAISPALMPLRTALLSGAGGEGWRGNASFSHPC